MTSGPFAGPRRLIKSRLNINETKHSAQDYFIYSHWHGGICILWYAQCILVCSHRTAIWLKSGIVLGKKKKREKTFSWILREAQGSCQISLHRLLCHNVCVQPAFDGFSLPQQPEMLGGRKMLMCSVSWSLKLIWSYAENNIPSNGL